MLLSIEKDSTLINNWLSEIKNIYRGHENIIRLIMACVIADGHVLLEDLPGTGKTLLAKTIAKTIRIENGSSLTSSFQRIQFTPDLLPMDILGMNVFNPRDTQFHFQPGPIFANMLLVDEINRASPKVQSALLEAMGEKQVTIDKNTYPLEAVFFVIGTENPIDHEGVFPLPLAQLDRFMMRLTPGFVSGETEKGILKSKGEINPDNIHPVISDKDITRWRTITQSIDLRDIYYRAVFQILEKSRFSEQLFGGLSTRAGMHLIASLRAWSFISACLDCAGTKDANPESIQAIITPEEFCLLAKSVLLHRVRPEYSQKAIENTLLNIITAETEIIIQDNQKDLKNI